MFFAGYREAVGSPSVSLTFSEGATVGDVAKRVSIQYPGLPKKFHRIVLAVNEEYRPHDFRLSEGDEVALIPPVSGGAINIYGEQLLSRFETWFGRGKININ